MSLLYYESAFSELNLHRVGVQTSPHKVAMLLAVTDLIEDGTLTDNRIHYGDFLTKAFAKRFRDLRSNADRANSIYPFFHLRSEGFWHHQLKPGRSDSYRRLSTVTSPHQVHGHIAFAYLDDELFELLNNQAVRDLLRSALHANLTITDEERRARLQVKGWNWLECEACVQDYFDMLGKDLRGESYSKAHHRRALGTRLVGRSRASIEYKYQNVSAVLIDLGLTYISGYKPRFNYQAQLHQVVVAHLATQHRELERINVVRDLDSPPYTSNWNNVLDPKIPEHIPAPTPPARPFLAKHVNYAQREMENRMLGEAGEQFVLAFERFHLTRAGRNDLAEEVEWSSKAQGDGLGYDIRSFRIEDDGVARDEELFIEVKTTNRGKYQPFYVSRNEIQFSRACNDHYSLYRVYEFRSRNRRLFRMPGRLDDHVRLHPTQYRASFG